MYADDDVGSELDAMTTPVVALTSSIYRGCAIPAAYPFVVASPTRRRARLDTANVTGPLLALIVAVGVLPT